MNEMIHFTKVTGRRARKVEGGVFFVSIVALPPSSSSSSSSSARVLKICPRACWTSTIAALHALLLHHTHTCQCLPHDQNTNAPAPLTDHAATLTMHCVRRQPAPLVFRSTLAELTSRHAEHSSADDSRTCTRRRIPVGGGFNWSGLAKHFTAYIGLESWKDDGKRLTIWKVQLHSRSASSVNSAL